MEKIFEVVKNGYKLKVVDFGDYKDLRVDDGNNSIKIYEYDDYNLHTNLQEGQYSKIDFKVETTSYGSLEVEEIQELINEYQMAVQAVKYFKKELKKFEKDSK